MSFIPQVNGSRVIRALQKAGFVLLRQSGSHAVLRHHTDLSRRAILRGARIAPEDFADLLK